MQTSLDQLASKIELHRERWEACHRGAAVLIPLVEGADGLEVLLEVRASTLAVQPGEVCLPGGRIEPGETPQEAAVRETAEELLVSPDQISVLGGMGAEPGPGGRTLHVFVGTLTGYEGTFSPAEVDRTFTLPVTWLANHEPRIYEVDLQPSYPEDFPWDLVPGGKAYAWRTRRQHVPFYGGTDPLVWGATARVLMRFARVWRGVNLDPLSSGHCRPKTLLPYGARLG